MSKVSKDLADSAKEDLKHSEDYAKSASKKFKIIGDPDGEKIADDTAKIAKKGVKHVEKRLR